MKRFCKNERGAALIMVLGVLSLIMLIALTFLHTNNDASIASRVLTAATATNYYDIENVSRRIAMEALEYRDSTGIRRMSDQGDYAKFVEEWPRLRYNSNFTTGNSEIENASMRFNYTRGADSLNPEAGVVKNFKDHFPYLKLLCNAKYADGKQPVFWRDCQGCYYMNPYVPDYVHSNVSVYDANYVGPSAVMNPMDKTISDDAIDFVYNGSSGKITGRNVQDNIFYNLGYEPLFTGYYTDAGGNMQWNQREIAGRYAYVIVDETGKLDINSIVASTGIQDGTDVNCKVQAPMVYATDKAYGKLAGPQYNFADVCRSITMAGTTFSFSDYLYLLQGTKSASDGSRTSAWCYVWPTMTVGTENADIYDDNVRLGLLPQEISYPRIFRWLMETSVVEAQKTLNVDGAGNASKVIKHHFNSFSDIYLASILYDSRHTGGMSAPQAQSAVVEKALTYRTFSESVRDDVANYVLVNDNSFPVKQKRFDISGFEWMDPLGSPQNAWINDGVDAYKRNLSVNGWNTTYDLPNGDQPGDSSAWHFLETLPDIGKDNFSANKLPIRLTRIYDLSDSGAGAYKFLKELSGNRQLCYNVKDYCDGDDFATWNRGSNAVNLSVTTPTENPYRFLAIADANAFDNGIVNLGCIDWNQINNGDALAIGREQVPYINEIDLQLNYTYRWEDPREVDDNGVTKIKQEVKVLDLYLNPRVELVNIYGNSVALPSTAKLLLFFDGAISIVPKDSLDSKILEFHYTLPDVVPASPVSVAWDAAGAGNLLQRPANVYDGNVWNIPLSEEVYDYGVYAENQFFTSSPGGFTELSFDEDLGEKSVYVSNPQGAPATLTFKLEINKVVALLFDSSKISDWSKFFASNGDKDFIYDMKCWESNTPLELIKEERDAHDGTDGNGNAVSRGVDCTDYGFIVLESSDPRMTNFSQWGTGNVPTFGMKNSNAVIDTDTHATFCHEAFVRNQPFETLMELGCIHTGASGQTIDLIGEDWREWCKIGPLSCRTGLFNPRAANDAMYRQLLQRCKPDEYIGVALFDNSARVSIGSSLSPKLEISESETSDLNDVLDQRLDDYTFDEVALTSAQKEMLFARCIELADDTSQYFTVYLHYQQLNELGGGASSAYRNMSSSERRLTTGEARVKFNKKKQTLNASTVVVPLQDDENDRTRYVEHLCRVVGEAYLEIQCVRKDDGTVKIVNVINHSEADD